MRIIGISAYYHDSAAALLVNGEVLAAAQEERFSRRRHDARFPLQALRFCLESQGLTLADIDQVVYYEKPLLTFERLLETSLGAAPRGGRAFVAAMQVWLKHKLFLKSEIRRQLARLGDPPELLFSEHHLSHAAAAFHPSPFERAAVLCMDGVGEWATTSAWLGEGHALTPLWEISFPHSLGLLYSAFTAYCGFRVNSGEYKLMGLAPYGVPRFARTIRDHLVDVKPDGSFRLNLSHFRFHRGLRMTGRRFHRLFGQPPRVPESEITPFQMDLAASIQQVTEEIVLALARGLRADTGARHLCLGGGVALNCVANGRLLRQELFERIWIQPASGDAGSALGAALVAWHQHHGRPRTPPALAPGGDGMKGAYLGPRFDNGEIRQFLESCQAPFQLLHDGELFERLAELLDQGQVIGWFSGPMEFGPRALGARSILADPRNPRMQSVINLKIKYRESFRPFAPAVLEEEVASRFELADPCPYMQVVAPVRQDRPPLPAITHVDGSARVQTVSATTNPRFHGLIRAFQRRTGCPILVNTSFNVRGEPIVCTPADAYRCFLCTELDALVLENHLLLKAEQPQRQPDDHGRRPFVLD